MRLSRPLSTSILAAALLVTAGCSDAPTKPSPTVTLSFATPVVATIVACDSCAEGPTIWATAEFPVTLTNPASADRTLVTLTTRVVNRTRGGEIARNVRPNETHAYPDVRIPAGGTLTLDAGIVYFPLPPPRDDVVVEVIAELQDGTTVTHSGTIVASGVS